MFNQTKTDTAKAIARFVVGSSVGFTASRVIKNNSTANKRRHKAEAYIGGAVIGAMAADAAEDWTDRKIDNIVETWNKIKSDLMDTTE